MDSPTDSVADEAASAPATYVPEPFDGLPEIFGVDEGASRSWRHRPVRAPKRRKPVGAHEPVLDKTPEQAPGKPPKAEKKPSHAREPGAAKKVDLAAKSEIQKTPVVVEKAAPVVVEKAPEPVIVVPPPVVAEAAPVRAPEPVVVTPPPVVVAPPPIRPRDPDPAPEPVRMTPPPPPPPPPVQLPAPPPPPVRMSPPPPPPPPVRLPPPLPPPRRVVVPEPPPLRVPQHQSTKWWPALPPPGPPEPAMDDYQPEPYDPRTAGAVLPAADILQLYGTVLRKRGKRGGFVTLLVLFAILLATSYYAWRQVENNRHHAPTDVAYTSAAGHFAARFPSTPTEATAIQRHGKVRMRVQTVADSVDHVAVGSARLSAGIPAKQTTAVLVGLSKGLGSAGVLTLARQQHTTFRGHPALEGELWAVDGSPFTFLATLYSDRQIYVLLAPAGASYAQLKASFIPVA